MLTPDAIAKSNTEHGHQAALFAWCAVAKIHGVEIADEWAKNGPFAFRLSQSSYTRPAIPALHWIHAIHNQGHGDAIRGGKAKAEGVKAGVADIFWPLPVWTQSRSEIVIAYAGLYIEMKKPSEKPVKETSKGGLSDEQIKFRDYAREVGYYWRVCYSWREAADVIVSYYNLKQ